MMYKNFYFDVVGGNVHIMKDAEIICICASIENAKMIVDTYCK